jgi:DNA uptake protein ComE-like DNA-binding protein
MRALLGLSTLGLFLATAALAQAPARHQLEVTPPASQTEPWLEELPARRGLEPRPNPADKGVLIDINSATSKELISLKNIGRTRAEDIIKGRPYNDKDDLVKRKILPPEVYDEIKDAIVARHQSNR